MSQCLPANSPPRIGITCNVALPAATGLYPGLPLEFLDRSLVRSVWDAGGVPLLLPVHLPPGGDPRALAANLLAAVDGLVLSGGEDLTWAAQPVADPAVAVLDLHEQRDRLEVSILRQATACELPILGICRGLQLLDVAWGGSLWSDLPTDRPGETIHRDRAAYLTHRHPVSLASDSLLERLCGSASIRVSSAHHQGIRQLGAGLRPTAWSPDGLVEACEAIGMPGLLAVQWHPEWMEQRERGGAAALFGWLVEQARTGLRRS